MKTITVIWANEKLNCEVKRGPIFNKEIGQWGYSVIPLSIKENRNVSSKWLFKKDQNGIRPLLFVKEDSVVNEV